MTRPTFERLAQFRAQLINQGFAPATPEQPGVAGLFLPWAGQRLAEAGGIYWVGAAAEGAYGAEGSRPSRPAMRGRPGSATAARTPAPTRRSGSSSTG